MLFEGSARAGKPELQGRDVQTHIQASRVRECPGVRHGCRRTATALTPADSRPRLASLTTHCDFLRGFAASREASRLDSAAERTMQGGRYPSPPSPLPFQRRGVRLLFSKPKNTKSSPRPQRGRGVGGEGDSHPGKPSRGPSKTQRTDLGLESPSYEENQLPTPDRTPNTVRRYSLRGFAASRETKQSAQLC